MFLRKSKQRRSDGSVLTHLQIAESIWNPEKKRSQTKIIFNCGRADSEEVVERLRRLARSILRRYSPEEIIAEHPSWRVVDAWNFGDIYVLEQLWERLGIADVIRDQSAERKFGFNLERALFSMVANRVCAPSSKLYCYEQWMGEDVRIEGAGNLKLQHLYRAMDFLEENREEIEKAIFFQVSDLLRLNVDLIFYDTASIYFEREEEEEQVEGKDKPLRKWGVSKDRREDLPQIVVGMAVTKEGFPVRHWVFPGNTVDVNTVQRVKKDLRGWQLGRCVFVGDAGMVSRKNMKALSEGGGKYILCMPMRRGDEVTKHVSSRGGMYRKVAENLQVKKVVLGKGEGRREYVVCYNPHEAAREDRRRDQIVRELEAELSAMKDMNLQENGRRMSRLKASKRYGKYLRFDKNGALRIDRAKIAAERKLDGKFVLKSNDDSLSAEDMALGYKQLLRVEEAWRTMKSGLKLRPVFHWAPHRICAHVTLNVLALLMERVAEHACKDSWRNIRDDLKRIRLAHLKSSDGELWQVTEPLPEAAHRLKKLKIKNPPPILRLG
jgi:transposase